MHVANSNTRTTRPNVGEQAAIGINSACWSLEQTPHRCSLSRLKVVVAASATSGTRASSSEAFVGMTNTRVNLTMSPCHYIVRTSATLSGIPIYFLYA